MSEGMGSDMPMHGEEAELWTHAYARLRLLARRQLRREGRDRTLDTTALVHEAWLSLAGEPPRFNDRAHFYACAARVMRHILVDRARRRQALKRGGDQIRLDLDLARIPVQHAAVEMLQLDEALARLHEVDPELVRVVELRFFAGLSVNETADVLGVVGRTVVRDWARARAFLKGALQ